MLSLYLSYSFLRASRSKQDARTMACLKDSARFGSCDDPPAAGFRPGCFLEIAVFMAWKMDVALGISR
jgi:hypothetical protein